MKDSKPHGYKCLNCGKEVPLDLQKAKKIICPYCGYRILEKKRPTAKKSVIAR
ncbi:MAG: DNA-directed RNA polymerase subunit P [Candidatus Aenigmarchaeota archaeon]